MTDRKHLSPAEFAFMVIQQTAARADKETVNAYVCDICGQITVSVDRDPGLVPFMLPCDNPEHLDDEFLTVGLRSKNPTILDRAKHREFIEQFPTMPDGRPVSARSCEYNTPFTPAAATVEMFRPSYSEYRKIDNARIREHIERGGLWFRPIANSQNAKGENENGTYEL